MVLVIILFVQLRPSVLRLNTQKVGGRAFSNQW